MSYLTFFQQRPESFNLFRAVEFVQSRSSDSCITTTKKDTIKTPTTAPNSPDSSWTSKQEEDTVFRSALTTSFDDRDLENWTLRRCDAFDEDDME
jgi:hypothetical protein